MGTLSTSFCVSREPFAKYTNWAGNRVCSPRNLVNRLPLQERVRQRLKQLVAMKDVSHATLGEYLGVSRSHVTRMLNEDGAIMLPHIEKFCEFFQVTAAELMTDPGALIQPLTPIEAAVLDIVRKMDRLRQHSLIDVLEWQQASTIPTKRRGRTPDHLTSEDAMVLSLYRAIEDGDAQGGIVMQMRAYVQAKHEADNGGTPGKK
jgi:transcriptional regulator with XRE-family HTH domain